LKQPLTLSLAGSAGLAALFIDSNEVPTDISIRVILATACEQSRPPLLAAGTQM
jgi:hypothetical protein